MFLFDERNHAIKTIQNMFSMKTAQFRTGYLDGSQYQFFRVVLFKIDMIAQKHHENILSNYLYLLIVQSFVVKSILKWTK